MRNNQNKYLILILSLSSIFFLQGCFNFGGSKTTTTTKVTADDKNRIYENAEYSVKIPREWDVIEKKDFTSDVPEETQVVFRNNVKNEDFTANINIVRNSLQNSRDTLQYAKEVINRQKTGLIGYKQDRQDLTKVSVGGKDVDSYYVEFEAKLKPDDAVTKFFQTFGVKGNQGYIIMGATSLQEVGTTQTVVSDIVKSFIIK